jgi:hypothetical protein
MITLVISGGDSFTFGSELSDTRGELSPSRSCWANLIANKLGAKHCNTGRGARGNSFITRHVIYKVNQALRLGYKPEEIFVQVMLTYVDRSEIAVNFDTKLPFDSPWYYLFPGAAEDESKSQWVLEQIKKAAFKFANGETDADRFANLLHGEYNLRKEQGITDFVKHYYTIISNLNDLYISLKSILLLQNFLENRNIKYMYTYVSFHVLDRLTQSFRNADKFLNSLRDNIKFDDWYKFPDSVKTVEEHYDRNNERYDEIIISENGFNDWARANKYEYGLSHPMEQAHEDAAELIYERVKEIVK